MTKLRIVASTAACAVAGAAIMLLIQPPRTEAQSPTQVRVVNGPARPVLTETAPEEIFRTVTAVALADAQNVASVEFDPVPAGKRLVIESVEVTVRATLGKPLPLISVRGGPFFHAVALQKQSSTSLWDNYVGTYSVRWYTDPGETVIFSASAAEVDSPGTATANVSLTGYYVPVP